MKYNAFLALCGLTIIAFGCRLEASEQVSIPNPGFEEGLGRWKVAESDGITTQAIAEAAQNGALGLRVEDKSSTQGCSVSSGLLPANPGVIYQLRFWSKINSGRGLNVYLNFYDSGKRKLDISSNQNSNTEAVVEIPEGASDWRQYLLRATAPEGAAFIEIWIHSAVGYKVNADIDSFSLTTISESSK